MGRVKETDPINVHPTPESLGGLVAEIKMIALDSCERGEECECFHGHNIDLILQKIQEAGA